jgi:hypothetical protein
MLQTGDGTPTNASPGPGWSPIVSKKFFTDVIQGASGLPPE